MTFSAGVPINAHLPSRLVRETDLARQKQGSGDRYTIG